ncbi:hypothetical protein N9N34_01535 [Candidatus Pelagibacter bacterium]|nr:hypothetical protein [Candidatus Pelagibacter bacterium]
MKIITNLILLLFLTLITLIGILSTIGIETNRFNDLISKNINKVNSNISLELTTIKFKLDIKEISLFLETANSQIYFKKIVLPTKNIKAYIDFISLIKSDPEIKKINLDLNELDIKQLKQISILLKPSNLTSFINNKIDQGKLNIELEIYLNNNNVLDNFIARGSVSNLKTKIVSNIILQEGSFSFFADKSDVLIKNIYGNSGPIKILDGDVKLKMTPKILLESNFTTNIKYNKKYINYLNLVKNFKYVKNITDLDVKLNNSFSISFDETYKVKKYNYKNNGKIIKADFNFKKPLKNIFSDKVIEELSLNNTEIKSSFNSKKNTTTISGNYSLNKGNNLPFNLDNTIDKDLLKLRLNADYNETLELKLINYKKRKNTVAKVFLSLEKQKEKIKINEIKISERNNKIFFNEIKLNKFNFVSLKKILIKTHKNGKLNNDFMILFGKNILVKGTQLDAINLPQFLNKKSIKNNFLNFSKNIEIDLKKIIAPLSENLTNFKLIGRIEKGKFTKISSKGDFGGNNYLDITMKKDKKSQKKYLEIYSDLTRPLLTEYNFFKGLTGGKLLYSSIIDGDQSNSNLKIENFNLINAPGVVRLLSLADLGGLADLAEGEGLSFDILEIKMEKNKDLLKLNEILALGPSVSVLMEGYQTSEVTSLKGTIVPAKNFNKLISKIPVIGDIIIPKEVGEGLFGVSFKMKGPTGKIKTSINPIRTLTPRFIQKMIEKNKKSK